MPAPFAPWLESPAQRTDGEERRADVSRAEITHRASLMYRLGVTADDASERLRARVAWEHGDRRRHESLSDDAIRKLVDDTYARRPA